MFIQMLRHSFLRRAKRKTLAIITILFASGLITALLSISLNVGDKMALEMKSYGANINVVPKSENIPLEIGGVDYNPLKGQVYLEEKYLPEIKGIFWQNNIVGFAPFLKVNVLTDSNGEDRIQLIGTFFNKHLPLTDEKDYHTGIKNIYDYWYVDGEWPDDKSLSHVLVGAKLAEKMDWKIGEQIVITLDEGRSGNKPPSPDSTVMIKGILYNGGSEENAIVAPLSLVQNMGGLKGKVGSVSVSALTIPEDKLSRLARRNMDALDAAEYDKWYCSAYVSSISHQLEEAIPNASARPIWQVAASEGTVINKIQLLMVVVTVAAFIAAALGISSLMNTIIMERSKHIGLMKALGASHIEVYLMFLSEAAIIGVLGGILGYLAGTGFSQLIGMMIFGSTVPVQPILIPGIIVISVLITMTGSFMPLRFITKIDPTEVLHGRK